LIDHLFRSCGDSSPNVIDGVTHDETGVALTFINDGSYGGRSKSHRWA
jgi:hypothetical protein